MAVSRLLYVQSLARIAESHIVIAPSKHQVIVNPSNGKREQIFVNLEAVYPTPAEPGTELSFEELWAASRGWLDARWDEESFADYPQQEQQPSDGNVPNVEDLTQKVATKLVVHQDAVELDENGALKNQQQQKPSKPRKKKLMEVNETQISQSPCPHLRQSNIVANPATSQSKARFTFEAQNEEKKPLSRAHHDFAHQSRDRRDL